MPDQNEAITEQSESVETETPKKGRSSLLGNIKIGAKIYILVAILIIGTITVSVVSVRGMQQIGAEIVAIAERDIPITTAVTNITIHQLEQVIEFEAALRFGESMTISKDPHDKEMFVKHENKFFKFSKKVKKEFKQAENLLKKFEKEAHTEAERKEFHRILVEQRCAALRDRRGTGQGQGISRQSSCSLP